MGLCYISNHIGFAARCNTIHYNTLCLLQCNTIHYRDWEFHVTQKNTKIIVAVQSDWIILESL